MTQILSARPYPHTDRPPAPSLNQTLNFHPQFHSIRSDPANHALPNTSDINSPLHPVSTRDYRNGQQFKSALRNAQRRLAVVPRINQSADLPQTSQNLRTLQKQQTLFCSICESCFHEHQMVSITECGHKYCSVCCTDYLTYKINAFQQIYCPEDECEKLFNESKCCIYQKLTEPLKSKRQKFLRLKLATTNPALKMCHSDGCQGLIDMSKQDPFCEKCQRKYCSKCEYTAHDGACTLFQIQFLRENYKYMQCRRCKNMVERSEGCRHMRCICGYQFCYNCGSRWGRYHQCRTDMPFPQPPATPNFCRTVGKVLFLVLYGISALIFCILLLTMFPMEFVVTVLFYGCFSFLHTLWTKLPDNLLVKILYFLGLPILYVVGIPAGTVLAWRLVKDKLLGTVAALYDNFDAIWNDDDICCL